MPLVTIDLLEGRPADELDAISDAVQQAMVETLDVPQRDRFHVITEHTPRTLRFDRGYLDIDRDGGFLLVSVRLSRGRATDAKRAFYSRLAELLAEHAGVRPENLAITLIESEREDWSFGNGEASYLEIPRERWR